MKKAINFTKKDEVNSVSATPLQKAGDDILLVTGAAITERPDENGEVKEVGLLATDHGTFSSISATAINGLNGIIDYMTDLEADNELGDGIQVRVVKNKSNAGREFLTLQIL